MVKRRTRKRGNKNPLYAEEVIFTISPGQELPFTYGNIAIADRVMTPRTVSVRVASIAQPHLAQLVAYAGDEEVATSTATLVGTNPTSLSLSFPKGYDSLPTDTLQLYKIAALRVLKVSANETGSIRGFMRVKFSASAESFTSVTKIVAGVPIGS